MTAAKPRIALIDTEEGFASVGNLVREGKVDHYLATTFDELKAATWKVYRSDPGYDIIVLDPISAIATTRTLELMAGSFETFLKAKEPVRANRDIWGTMNNDIIRCYRQLAESNNKKATLVITCHEGQRDNPYDGTTMTGPDLNQGLLKDVYEFSDAIVRLSKLPQAVKIDGVEYKKGTRVARLQDSPQYLAKGRDEVGGPTRPELIAAPTLPKIFTACNPAPRKILLYGAPGVGKTVLAVSHALEA